MNTSRRLAAVLAPLLLAAAGCGGGESAGPSLTGTVTFNGQPLPDANLTFEPDGPGGATAYGRSDENGVYTVHTGRSLEGIAPGKYNVGVEAYTIQPGMFDAAGNYVENGQLAIPKSFTSPKTSGLFVVVTEAPDNTADIPIEGEAPTAPEAPTPDAAIR